MIQLSYESNVYLNFKIVVKCLLGNRVELSVSLHYYEAEHCMRLNVEETESMYYKHLSVKYISSNN